MTTSNKSTSTISFSSTKRAQWGNYRRYSL